ncbi:MAG: hypothetical protein HY602_00230, partial [Parcubacteria group bacterium]|nr:hypothetical protein [Parcubacteria group bacterium]
PQSGSQNLILDPHFVVDALFTELNNREREVLERRYGITGERHTLEEIGKDYSVTRERIRQIESATIRKIKKLDGFFELIKPAEDAIIGIIQTHGGLMEHNHLVDTALGGCEDSQKTGALCFIIERLLDHKLSPIYDHEHLKDSWKLEEVEDIQWIDRIMKLIEMVEEYKEPVSEDILFEKYCSQFPDDPTCIASRPIFKSHLKLSHKLGENVFGEWGMSYWNTIHPKRINDKIYIVLKKQQKPLHFSEIAHLINEMKFDSKVAYPATVHNELILDKKYVLVGRGIYALSEWGYKHGIVADVIGEILKQLGPLTREALVDQVLKQRLVGRSTIHLALMNKDRFQRLEDGRYTAK